MTKMKINNQPASESTCKGRLNSIADALYVIGGKWKMRIIVALMDGNKRFNELQRLVEGTSAKMLSFELKELELNGFVTRNVFTDMPVIVEYELSEYAGTLHTVLQSLSEWGEMHKQNVRKSMKQKKAI